MSAATASCACWNRPTARSGNRSALVAEKGIDLRDPKLSITPDDRLMIVAGGSVYEGKTLLGPAAASDVLEGRPRVDAAAARADRGRMAVARDLARRQGVRRLVQRRGAHAAPAAKEAAKTGKVDSPARPTGSSSSSPAATA